MSTQSKREERWLEERTYLKDLVELLLFKIGVFQVHSNFLVLTRHTQVATVITIFVELSLPEPIYVVEYLTWVLVA